MTAQIISNHQSAVAVSVDTANGNNLMGVVSDNKGGFWVGAISLATKNKPGKVYYHPLTGSPSSFNLPYTTHHTASTDAPSPSASEIILHKEILYISDDNYGTIYQYDIEKKLPDASVLVEIPPSGTLKSQSAGMTIIDDKSLWFLEIHGCWLCSHDMSSPGSLEKYDLAKIVNIMRTNDETPPLTPGQALITTKSGSNNYLWLVMINNEDVSQSWLIRVEAEHPNTVMKWDLDDAKSLALDNETLYISTSMALLSKNIHDDKPPAHMCDLDAITGTYMTVDPAGYLWISDFSENGKVYEIAPDTGVLAAYQLATPLSGHPPVPAQMIWNQPITGSKQDALLVVDSASNARVIMLSPPDSIDRAGKSALKIFADPDVKTVTEGEELATTISVKDDKTPIESLVQFRLMQSPDKVISSTLPVGIKEGALLIPQVGENVRMQAGHLTGNIELQAKIRGGGGFVTVFKGTIAAAVMDVSFKNIAVQKASAMQEFPAESRQLEVNVVPKKAGTAVKLTLKNGTFDAGTDTLTLPTDNDGIVKVPAIRAGNKAGDMIITAEAGGKSKLLTWKVRAEPAIIKFNDEKTYSRALTSEVDNLIWTVLGYEINGDNTSPKVSVPGASILIEIKDDSAAHFLKNSVTLKTATITTDDKGEATLNKEGYSIHIDNKRVSKIRLTVHAVNDSDKAHPFVTLEPLLKFK